MPSLEELRKGRTPEVCKYHDRCGAPLCPLDPSIREFGFIQDDEVCINEEFQNLKFVKMARIIHNKRTVVEGYFTMEDLKKMYDGLKDK